MLHSPHSWALCLVSSSDRTCTTSLRRLFPVQASSLLDFFNLISDLEFRWVSLTHPTVSSYPSLKRPKKFFFFLSPAAQMSGKNERWCKIGEGGNKSGSKGNFPGKSGLRGRRESDNSFGMQPLALTWPDDEGNIPRGLAQCNLPMESSFKCTQFLHQEWVKSVRGQWNPASSSCRQGIIHSPSAP